MLLTTRPATAGPGGGTASAPWWSQWNGDPVILLSLALVVHLYLRGTQRLWRHGRGRGIQPWRTLAFYAAIAVLAAALLSPLDNLSEKLISVHMVQHLLLMNLAAPLLVLGGSWFVILHGIPGPFRPWLGRGWRRLDRDLFRNPVAAGVIFAIVLWGWHLPVLYQSALRDRIWHDAEHVTFIAAAYVFWRIVLDPIRQPRLPALGAALFLFAATLHSTALGLFMILSPQPWYPVYDGRGEAWGLTSLEDQQLAGLMMWIPAGTVFILAAAATFLNGLQEQERDG